MGLLGLLIPGVGMGGGPSATTPLGAASIRWEVASNEAHSLSHIGMVPGVQILAVSAMNGVGLARMQSKRSTDEASFVLTYRAPGSASFGPGVTVTADAEVLLLDGENVGKFLRVQVHFDYLMGGPADAAIAMDREFVVNGSAFANVTAAQAAAGDQNTGPYTLRNVSSDLASSITAWMDASSYLEISEDGIAWTSAAVNEGTAISLGSLAAGASRFFHVRRTIPASEPYDPSILAAFHIRYVVDGTPYYSDVLDRWRIFNDAEFRFFSGSVPPVETDTPVATNATLPFTIPTVLLDGDHYYSVSWFNGCIDSGFLPLGPNGETYRLLRVSTGDEAPLPPFGPMDFRLENLEGGVVRVVASYAQTGALRANEWAIAFTVNGGDPVADAPDVVKTMQPNSVAVLTYSLPAQSDGDEVRVRLQTRRSGTVYSEGSIVRTILADDAGPDATLTVEQWPGIPSVGI